MGHVDRLGFTTPIVVAWSSGRRPVGKWVDGCVHGVSETVVGYASPRRLALLMHTRPPKQHRRQAPANRSLTVPGRTFGLVLDRLARRPGPPDAVDSDARVWVSAGDRIQSGLSAFSLQLALWRHSTRNPRAAPVQWPSQQPQPRLTWRESTELGAWDTAERLQTIQHLAAVGGRCWAGRRRRSPTHTHASPK